MNYYMNTQQFHNNFLQDISIIMSFVVQNQHQFTQERVAAYTATLNDRRLMDELMNVVVDQMELGYLNNRVNFNDQNSVMAKLEEVAIAWVPYCIHNYLRPTNIHPQQANAIANDASAFARNRDNYRRQLIDIYQRQQSGYGQSGYGNRNGYVNGNGYNFNNNQSFGYGGNYNNDYNNGKTLSANSVSGGSMFKKSHGQSEPSYSSRASVFNYGNTFNESSNGFSMKDILKNKQKQEPQPAPTNNQSYRSPKNEYEELVDENVIELKTIESNYNNQTKSVKEEPQQNASFYYQKFKQEQTTEYVEEETKKNPNRISGVNWFVDVSETDEVVYRNNRYREASTGKAVADMWHNPEVFIERRKAFAPKEFYPFDIDELYWEDGCGIAEVRDEDGSTYREYVFMLNKSNPIFKAWDRTQYKCLIQLDESYMPVQTFVKLTEEEKMQMKDHLIPGSVQRGFIESTVVPYRKLEDSPENNLQLQIESLGLSEEERKEQEERILAEGESPGDNLATVLSEQVISSVEALPHEVLDIIDKEVTGNKKLVSIPVIVTYSVYTHKRQNELLDKIKECKTFDNYVAIHKELGRRKEYVLLKHLSKLIDKQYNKGLACIGITSFTVDDIVVYYNDVIEREMIPSHLIDAYHEMIENLFRNLLDKDLDSLLSEEELNSSRPTYIGRNANVVYVNRLLSDFAISHLDMDQMSQWYQVSKQCSQELYYLANKLTLDFKLDEQLQDIYILTADGALIEIAMHQLLRNEMLFRVIE